MDINGYLDGFLEAGGKQAYDNIRDRFSFHRFLQFFGRSVTLYEIVRAFQKRAAQKGVSVNRHMLFSQFTLILTTQKPEDIVVKTLYSFDRELVDPVKREMRRNTPDFFEGELKVISPAAGEPHFDSVFREYYRMRFVLLKDFGPAIPRTIEEFSRHVRNASDCLREAISDGEVITFGAAFLKYCVDVGSIHARMLFSQKLHENALVERMERKYAMSREDADALRYILHLSFNSLAKAA